MIKESINSNNFSDDEHEDKEFEHETQNEISKHDFIESYRHPNILYNNQNSKNSYSESSEDLVVGSGTVSEKINSPKKEKKIFLTGENEGSGMQLDHEEMRPFRTIRSSFNPDDFDD